MPVSVSFIRHAEKQLGDGPPYGVLADGSPDPNSLTPRGWQRAGALVSLFVPRPEQAGSAPFATPTHLFASEIGPHSHSRRPLETLQPLSDRLGLGIQEPVLQDELDRLVAVIRRSDGHVLVAWEHKRLPLIVNNLLGETVSCPQVWPDDRFDVVWVLEPGPAAGGFSFRQVPQLLLAGDRADLITSVGR